MRILQRKDYVRMPWKNGGGTTEEILVHPAFRLSLATVATSGPFSVFPGIDRVILQLSGKPMTLVHGRVCRAGEGESLGSHTLTPLVPYRFSGDWATDSRIDGQAEDLNLMTRRGAATAHAESLRLQSGQ